MARCMWSGRLREFFGAARPAMKQGFCPAVARHEPEIVSAGIGRWRISATEHVVRGMVERLVEERVPKHLLGSALSKRFEILHLLDFAAFLSGFALVLKADRRKAGFGNPDLLARMQELPGFGDRVRPATPNHFVPGSRKRVDS